MHRTMNGRRACATREISALTHPSDIRLATKRAKHIRREIALCGDIRDTKQYPMEQSLTDGPPLGFASRPITALNDAASEKT